jgi:DNA sulfur modification protein DndB
MGKNPVAPEQEELERAYRTVAKWWDEILTLDVFVSSLDDLAGMREARFEPSHRHTLLLRPVGQVALIEGLALAIGNSQDQLTLTEALRRANQINWSCTPESVWRDTIVRADGRMVARKEARELAARLIAYLIGAEFMTEEDRQKLWKDWNLARGCDVDGDLEMGDPEGLPNPIAG